LTSKLAGADEVGGVMGVYQSMSSLARIFGPFWAEMVYGGLGYHWPFRTGSVFMLLACGLGLVVLSRSRNRDSEGSAFNN
jgi:MFS family permease